MADIKIYNLKIAGSDLFTDTENYLQDLLEEELNFQGGKLIGFVINPTVKTSYVLSVYHPFTTRFPD